MVFKRKNKNKKIFTLLVALLVSATNICSSYADSTDATITNNSTIADSSSTISNTYTEPTTSGIDMEATTSNNANELTSSSISDKASTSNTDTESESSNINSTDGATGTPENAENATSENKITRDPKKLYKQKEEINAKITVEKSKNSNPEENNDDENVEDLKNDEDEAYIGSNDESEIDNKNESNLNSNDADIKNNNTFVTKKGESLDYTISIDGEKIKNQFANIYDNLKVVLLKSLYKSESPISKDNISKDPISEESVNKILNGDNNKGGLILINEDLKSEFKLVITPDKNLVFPDLNGNNSNYTVVLNGDKSDKNEWYTISKKEKNNDSYEFTLSLNAKKIVTYYNFTKFLDEKINDLAFNIKGVKVSENAPTNKDLSVKLKLSGLFESNPSINILDPKGTSVNEDHKKVFSTKRWGDITGEIVKRSNSKSNSNDAFKDVEKEERIHLDWNNDKEISVSVKIPKIEKDMKPIVPEINTPDSKKPEITDPKTENEIIKPDTPKTEKPKNDIPEPNIPKTEKPKENTPKNNIPKIEVPKKDIPKDNDKTVKPNLEKDKNQEPKVNVPKIEKDKNTIPKSNSPKIEKDKDTIPKVNLPKIEKPKNEVPKVKAPEIEKPKNEKDKMVLPKSENDKNQMPKQELPNIEKDKNIVPKSDIPKSETPKIDIPKDEMPKNQVPKKNLPEIKTPEKRNSETEIDKNISKNKKSLPQLGTQSLSSLSTAFAPLLAILAVGIKKKK